ncbi:MAG: tetratricopeptide repeat protein [Caldilineaceae bacterium]
MQLHARIAITLKLFHAPQLDAHLADLAYHSVRGHLWERTLRYSRQIGENVGDLCRLTAVEHFSHALEAAAHRPEFDPGDLYHRRGLAYAQVGDFAAAAEDFRRASNWPTPAVMTGVAGRRCWRWQPVGDARPCADRRLLHPSARWRLGWTIPA